MTRTVLITGASGFIGSNLVQVLSKRRDLEVITCHRDSPPEVLTQGAKQADVVIHLAGVNRPMHPDEFQEGNVDYTVLLCERLRQSGKRPLFILSSSIQASQESPYGKSKRAAEVVIEEWVAGGAGRAVIFRLKNVFGKWCRPDYNSVVATFCHRVASNLPIQISDENRELELVYIDDVVAALIACIDLPQNPGIEWHEVSPVRKVSLRELAQMIRLFRESRDSLLMPDFSDAFVRKLYATYLSYLPPDDFSYGLQKRADNRGVLAEVLKSSHIGQIFISRTNPGISRGNHYHNTKAEKFIVVEGTAIVRFRSLFDSQVIEYCVHGMDFRVIDIPPGYTHSIENIGSSELVTIFWASEIYDNQAPDTEPLLVQNNK